MHPAKPKILVSMTSYPGRIANVYKAIGLLLTNQTQQPDEIHLWLAKSEFPQLEQSLPKELQAILKLPTIFLHWLDKNTYVHKRHEIFKIAPSDACVFFIDDDVRYNDNLIKTVMAKHAEFPNAIICYNLYSTHKYRGRRILYENISFKAGPHINKNRWCGQSMIPVNVYPKESLSPENQAIRDRTSPISDECWFQPWIVYNNIPIFYFAFGWGIDIDPNNGKCKGLCKYSHEKESNGYERRDNWLYAVLQAYPEFMKKYQHEFNYGNI